MPLTLRLVSAAFAASAVFALTPATSANTEGEVSLSGSYLAGHVAQKRRDLSAAAKYFGRALEKDAHEPDLMRRAFLFNVMKGDMEAALDLAARFTAIETKGPIANLALAVKDVRKEDWADVEARMSALDGTGLNSFTVPTLRAWAAFATDGKDGALEMLKPLRDIGGARALHDMHAGLVNELGGDLAAAENYYIGVAEDDAGGSLRGSRILGTFYERQGKIDEAKAALDLYIQSQPRTQFITMDLKRLEDGGDAPVLVKDAKDGVAEALFGISSSLNRQSGYETALVLGRLALYLRPEFPVMQYTVGGILESLERYEDAIQVYQTLPDGTPFSASAQLRVAHNLDRIERGEEAIGLLKQVIETRPTDARAITALGDVYRRHERWDDAVAAYDDAFEQIGDLEHKHWQLLYTRGIVLERAKLWDRAEQDFLKALEFEKDQPLVLNYLGYSWVEKGRYLDRALEMIRTAVAKRPHDGYIADSLGWVYYKLGRFQEAVPELERAVELRPEDPVINDHLGDAYWRVGRKLEATYQWNHALVLDPEQDLKVTIEEKLENGLVDSADAANKTSTDGG